MGKNHAMTEPSHGPSMRAYFHLVRGAEMAIMWPPKLAVTTTGDQYYGTLPPVLTQPSHRPPPGPVIIYECLASPDAPLSRLRHPEESACAHRATPGRNRHRQGTDRTAPA